MMQPHAAASEMIIRALVFLSFWTVPSMIQLVAPKGKTYLTTNQLVPDAPAANFHIFLKVPCASVHVSVLPKDYKLNEIGFPAQTLNFAALLVVDDGRLHSPSLKVNSVHVM
jgi:hypothetical protein